MDAFQYTAQVDLRAKLSDCHRIRRLLEEENTRLRAEKDRYREQFSAVTDQCSMHLETIREYQERIAFLEAEINHLHSV